jgi:hypothetical protein
MTAPTARRVFGSKATRTRVIVLLPLLLALPAIGFVAARVKPELVLVAIGAPLVLLLVTQRLELSVLSILGTAAFVRFSLPTGTESRIVASLLVTAMLVVLWVVKMLVNDRKLYLVPASTNIPLLGFVVTAIISYAWSSAFRDQLVVVWRTWPFVQLGGLAVMVLLPAAFLLTGNILTHDRWLKMLCGLMVLIGVLGLSLRFLHLNDSFLNMGGLFSLWFVSLTYSQALFNSRLPLWLRAVLLGLVAAWVYFYFVQHVTWLAGWLPSFVAMAIISFVKSKRLFVALTLVVLVYAAIKWDYYVKTVFPAENVESGVTRMSAWEHNWIVTSQHLLFGTGPAGYAVYYMAYFPTEAMATHNGYLDTLSQTGIVGLLFCLWFFVALGLMGYKLCRRLKGTASFGEGYAVAALGGWAGCVLAMALGDWMFPFVYTQGIGGFDYAVYSWVLLGGIVALANTQKMASVSRSEP